jgi:hypothetical protein
MHLRTTDGARPDCCPGAGAPPQVPANR